MFRKWENINLSATQAGGLLLTRRSVDATPNRSMKVKLITVLFGMFFLFSCKKPVKEDFIGSWKSADEAMVVLREDSTCIIQGIDAMKIWGKGDDSGVTTINCSGRWEFVSSTKSNSHYCIYIDSEKGGFPLNVTGTGFTGYFKPWKLFIYIGDPDDMNFYEFYKQ